MSEARRLELERIATESLSRQRPKTIGGPLANTATIDVSVDTTGAETITNRVKQLADAAEKLPFQRREFLLDHLCQTTMLDCRLKSCEGGRFVYELRPSAQLEALVEAYCGGGS